MTDPFADYVPEENDYEKYPAIQLSTVGDTFRGTITRVGQEFLQQVDNGSIVKYPVELKLTFVNIKPLEEVGDVQRAYEPPKVGEIATYFVMKTKQDGKVHHIHEEITRACRKSDVDSIAEGGDLAGKLLEKVKNPNFPTRKPFKKHAFLYKPGDPFASGGPSAASAPPAPVEDEKAALLRQLEELKRQAGGGNDSPPF